MKVKKEFFYKSILFLLLLLPTSVASVELNVFIGVFFSLFIFFDTKTKFSATLINALFPITLILLVAAITSFFYTNKAYDILKDISYLIKPILFIGLGYYLTQKITDKEFIFKAITYLAFLFAAIHIYQVVEFIINNQFNVNAIRGQCGKANFLEMLAIVLLFTNKEQKYFTIRFKYYSLLKFMLYISFILYFSRTMFLALFILALSFQGYTKLTRKGVIYLSSFLGFIALFYVFLNTIEINRDSIGIDGFLYKLKIAPSEIFSSEIDVQDHANLWDHWRGYEALKAFEQLEETKYSLGLFVGKGLGALVDLEFVAPLNNDGIQFISTIHNGYAYILFKSGIIGFICYFLFLVYIYLQAYQKNGMILDTFANNVISGLAIYFMFTTLVISGIYNQGDIMTIILGAFIYLKHYSLTNLRNENRNIRN